MKGTVMDIANANADSAIGTLRERLLRARKIWRLSESLARGFLWCGGVLAALLILGLADNLVVLPGALRLGLGLVFLLAAAGSLAGWVLKPAFWRINDQAAAVYMERKVGERENLLINAVQLKGRMAGAHASGGSQAMILQVLTQAASRAAELSLNRLWEKERIKKLGLAAGAALLALLLYAFLLPAYAQNAFRRYTRPLSGVPPLSKTRVLLHPAGAIEVLAGERLTIHGLAYVEKGAAPAQAAVIAEVDGSVRRLPMARTTEADPELLKRAGRKNRATAFVYEFPNLNQSFTFHLASGDGQSLPCRVKVRAKPAVEDLSVEITPPSYTGRKRTREPAPNGLVHALPGARAALLFKPTEALASGRLKRPQGPPVKLKKRSDGLWEGAFAVEKEGPYALALVSAGGVAADPAFEGQVLLRTDTLPTALFENQSLNMAALPGSTVPLAVRAQDDYGLKSLRLIVRKQETDMEGAEKKPGFIEIKQWRYPRPGARKVNELYPLTLDPAHYAAGGTYAVYAEVDDHCPRGKRTYRSAPLLIRILSIEQMGLSENSPFRSIFERLQKLIDLQVKARGKTVTVKAFLDEIMGKRMLFKRLTSIRGAQAGVQGATRKLRSEIEAAQDAKVKKQRSALLGELRSLEKGPMAEALGMLNNIRSLRNAPERTRALLDREERVQRDILNRLTALLGSVATLGKEKKESEADLDDDQDAQRLREKLKDAKSKVKEFIKAQKKIVQASEELENKDPDDLTEEDKKHLGELAKEEEDWAKYFREKFTDLSKVPDQDFSNSKLAQEFNEVFQEIQKAAKELQDKNVEIAVPNEQAGLELAEKLETNLEKWLPDTKDTQKWNMEEPQGEFDVPLADLPEELEDIIGELIDDEEEMSDEVEDVSSSWMDSLDKGAGWDAMDGNISNMSAKGVTGNRLPNQQEISGRSGEGRSGKSHGQFVEQTADGKGGRQTPTRNTQDPYEEGQVKDTSTDALGGSTGGGKVSGAAAGGLRGAPPPETAAKLERLKGAQASLRQKAEKISTRLRAYHLPSSDMEEAVRRMKQIESHLKAGRGFNLRQAHSRVMDRLKEAKKVVGYQAKLYKERSRPLPKHVRNKILSGMQERAPQGYQDLLEAYYKALVEREK